MRSTFTLLLLVFPLLGLLLLSSCGSDEGVSADAVNLNFETSTMTEAEGSGQSRPIRILADQVVSTTGRITVSLSGNAVYGVDYTTEPAASNGSFDILFPENSDRAIVRINVLQNNDEETNKRVILTLTSPQGGVKPGRQADFTFTIENYAAAQPVIFDKISDFIAEENNSFPQELKVYWGRGLFSPGELVIGLTTEMVEGVDFTISPALSPEGTITFTPTVGEIEVVMTVTFIDNDVFEGNKTMVFEVLDASGGLQRGTTDQRYTIEVWDDESPRQFAFRDTEVTMEESPSGSYFDVYIEAPDGRGAAGWVDLQITSPTMVYNQDYFTREELTDGVIRVDIQENFGSERIAVLEVRDNDTADGERSLTLELIGAGGGVEIASPSVLTITVIDDE